MNHQMIVVKLQPLWMLLLRGSTQVYSGAHTVRVGDLWYRLYTLRRCLFYSYCRLRASCGRVESAGEHCSSSSYTFGQHKLRQSNQNQGTRRERTLPSGRGTMKLPLAPQEPCRGANSKVTVTLARIARKHYAMDFFQPR